MSKFHIVLLSLCILLVASVLVYFSIHNRKEKLSEKIIEKIDQTSDENGYCTVDLNEVTDFEWDKAVFFEASSSSRAVSELLGIDFTEMNDMNYGMIFAYQNEIVYKEIFAEIVESPNRFRSSLFKSGDNGGKCELVTPDNANVYARRFQRKNKYYYSIEIGGRTPDIL